MPVRWVAVVSRPAACRPVRSTASSGLLGEQGRAVHGQQCLPAGEGATEDVRALGGDGRAAPFRLPGQPGQFGTLVPGRALVPVSERLLVFLLRSAVAGLLALQPAPSDVTKAGAAQRDDRDGSRAGVETAGDGFRAAGEQHQEQRQRDARLADPLPGPLPRLLGRRMRGGGPGLDHLRVWARARGRGQRVSRRSRNTQPSRGPGVNSSSSGCPAGAGPAAAGTGGLRITAGFPFRLRRPHAR